MTVVIQRRRPSRNGEDELTAYHYQRAYRLGGTVLGVGPIEEGTTGEVWDGFREFHRHSIDEVLFDDLELVPRSTMLEDLGADRVKAGQVNDDLVELLK